MEESNMKVIRGILQQAMTMIPPTISLLKLFVKCEMKFGDVDAARNVFVDAEKKMTTAVKKCSIIS